MVQQIQDANFGSTNSGQKFWARNFFSTNLGHKLWINKFRTHTLNQKVNHTKFRTQTLAQDIHLIFSLAPNPKHPPFSSHVSCGKIIVVICILRVNLESIFLIFFIKISGFFGYPTDGKWVLLPNKLAEYVLLETSTWCYDVPVGLH